MFIEVKDKDDDMCLIMIISISGIQDMEEFGCRIVFTDGRGFETNTSYNTVKEAIKNAIAVYGK